MCVCERERERETEAPYLTLSSSIFRECVVQCLLTEDYNAGGYKNRLLLQNEDIKLFRTQNLPTKCLWRPSGFKHIINKREYYVVRSSSKVS